MSNNKKLNLGKDQWGPGPWQDEPDRLEFEYKGFPCLMVRNTGGTGSWCGYVAVPPGHPAFEKSYQGLDLDVHGGLTYSDHCSGHICHEPKPGEPDNVWWLGFDCAHGGDLSPRMRAFEEKYIPQLEGFHNINDNRFIHGTYKDVAYVKKEIRRLADQLAAIK